MKLLRTLTVLLLATSPAWAAPELSSTKDHGRVSLLPADSLSGGRFLIRIAAQNGGAAPTSFGVTDIHITTAGGRAVALVPLDKLIAETHAAARANSRAQANVAPHSPDAYSHDDAAALRDSAGNVVQGNWGGAAGSAPVVQSYDARGGGTAAADEQAQVAALRAGVLQSSTVPPGGVAAGQLVTEALKFKGREEHSLHIVILLNGEQHEFDVPVPAEAR